MYVDGVWIPNDLMEKLVPPKANNPGWVSETGGAAYKAATVTSRILPPAIYKFENTDSGMFFRTQQFPTDDVVSLPGLPSEYILDQIKLFWEKGDTYKKFGFVHKRGVLLYGSPGCGKTSVARLLCNEVLSQGGVVFSIDDFKIAASAVSIFRSVEPDRPILTLQEDIEGLFVGNEGAAQIKAALSFLDGQDQFNNIVHVATTNKPEEIADRFIKRPGRFDLVIGVKTPTKETREAYFKHVVKEASEEQLKELVNETSGLELSYLREVASTYLCLGIPINESVGRLRNNSKTKLFRNDKKSGFVLGYNNVQDEGEE